MRRKSAITVSALAAAALCFSAVGAGAFDDAAYPNLRGQWNRTGSPRFDPARPDGRGQQAPFTAEYQAIFEAGLADVAAGGHGTDPTYVCLSPGMPRIMNVYWPMEVVVLPQTTYIMIEHIHDNRRIYTDGRDWPDSIEPTFAGYSIGRWIDAGGLGHYDTLEVETRHFKGPRNFDTSGLPLHRDNQSIVKERIHLDAANADTLVDEITVIDHALTRPWSVVKRFRRNPDPRPVWLEEVCAENNGHIVISNEDYFLSAEGMLMPSKKNQPAPDLRYFGGPRK
jgi:hypothetical protein